MASRFTGSSSMKISSKLWCISSAAVIFSPLFSLLQFYDLSFDLPGHSSPGISLKILRRNREWLVRNGYHSMKTLWARGGWPSLSRSHQADAPSLSLRLFAGTEPALSEAEGAGILISLCEPWGNPSESPITTLKTIFTFPHPFCDIRPCLPQPSSVILFEAHSPKNSRP